MHSIRMRTGRSLTVCQGDLLPGGEGGLLPGGLLPGGLLPGRSVSGDNGAPFWGEEGIPACMRPVTSIHSIMMRTSRLLTISHSMGVSSYGVSVQRGLCLGGGGSVCPITCWDTHTPRHVNRMAVRCKNIYLGSELQSVLKTNAENFNAC